MLVGMHAAPPAAPPPLEPLKAAAAPLLLTAGDGPWQWRRARYELLDGAMDDGCTTYATSTVRRRKSLGALIRTDGDRTVTFEFGGTDAPLHVELGVTHMQAGVGSRVWESSLALALFHRHFGPASFPPHARVLELGAGLGVPGLDLCRMAGVRSVTMSDAHACLLDLIEKNGEAARRSAQSLGEAFAPLHTMRLEWGGDDAAAAATNLTADFDVIFGSDVCYHHKSIEPLVGMLEAAAMPLAYLISPQGRPSHAELTRRLKLSERLRVAERKLTLVAANADARPGDDAATFHSAGVHSLLTITHAAHAAHDAEAAC